jgi:protein TonB
MVVEPPGVVASARAEPADARLRLRLVVRTDGTVGDVTVAVTSGRAELDAAAVAASRAWRFLPARRDGTAIDSVVLIWVLFTAGP